MVKLFDSCHAYFLHNPLWRRIDSCSERMIARPPCRFDQLASKKRGLESLFIKYVLGFPLKQFPLTASSASRFPRLQWQGTHKALMPYSIRSHYGNERILGIRHTNTLWPLPLSGSPTDTDGAAADYLFHIYVLSYIYAKSNTGRKSVGTSRSLHAREKIFRVTINDWKSKRRVNFDSFPAGFISFGRDWRE